MFLDDELTQIWEQDFPLVVKTRLIITACVNRLKEGTTLEDIMRVDNSFRLFAKKTNGINPDFFRDYCIRLMGDEFRKNIGW